MISRLTYTRNRARLCIYRKDLLLDKKLQHRNTRPLDLFDLRVTVQKVLGGLAASK